MDLPLSNSLPRVWEQMQMQSVVLSNAHQELLKTSKTLAQLLISLSLLPWLFLAAASFPFC